MSHVSAIGSAHSGQMVVYRPSMPALPMEPSWDILDVPNPHELVRLAGKYKFKKANSRFKQGDGSQVVYRGHSSLHATCLPSGARGSSGPSSRASISRLSGDIRKYVDVLMEGECTCHGNRPLWYCPEVVESHGRGRPGSGLTGGTPRAAVEPLLQHYGLRTRWVDAVDNIWVALWFACHTLQVNSKSKKYAYHVRRSIAQEPEGYAYISVISSGPLERIGSPGCWEGPKSRLIDLRIAAPSLYLRPHAQHALSIAAHNWNELDTIDIGPLHNATLRIRLGDALLWLGDGTMLRPFVLFPPAAIDDGYRRLLDRAPEPPTRMGKFLIYGPGN